MGPGVPPYSPHELSMLNKQIELENSQRHPITIDFSEIERKIEGMHIDRC
jgi:hypothetical protein